MKISGKSLHAPPNPTPDSDLQPPKLFHRKKPRTPGKRLRKIGAPNGRRSRPETPLLKWKIHERNDGGDVGGVGDDDPVEEDQKSVVGAGRRSCRRKNETVSARKLAAGLWRLHLPEMPMVVRRSEDRLRLQHGIGHVGLPFPGRPNAMAHASDLKNLSQSPRSISGPKSGHFCELEPSFQFSNTEMEGATKWDPLCLKTSDEAQHIYNHMKFLDQKVSAVSVVSALEAELEQARTRIQELETERRSSKKKLEHFLKKVSEERAQWRSREHEKIRAYIDDIKAELSRERKSRQRFEIVNSKLVNELADVKLAAKRYMQEYEKEKKERKLIEEVCDELAKEIGDDKAEVEALKRESMKLREEVEEERKMLQMAEVWREERVQMKLIDAKVALEDKYSQMNILVAELEALLKSKGVSITPKEMKEAQSLQQAAAAMNIQDIKGFSYEPPNSEDIFAIFEDMNFGEPNEREIEPCVSHSPGSHASKIHRVSPEAKVLSKNNIQRHSDVFMDDNGDMDEDESGWETVSHVEDQGSSYSPEGSVQSFKKNHRQSNVSGRSVLEWEENAGQETPITEISEVCSIPAKQSKKVSSIARLWKSGPTNGDNYKIISLEGIHGRLSNGRLSNVGIMSPDHGSGKGGLSPQDILYQLSPPDSGNLHRGMKGCIPRTGQKHSLKTALLMSHILPTRIPSDAWPPAATSVVRHTTLSSDYHLHLTTNSSGHKTVDSAAVLHPDDVVRPDGVIHGIERLLVPRSVQEDFNRRRSLRSIAAVLPEGAPEVDPRTHRLKKPAPVPAGAPPVLPIYDAMAPGPSLAPAPAPGPGGPRHHFNGERQVKDFIQTLLHYGGYNEMADILVNLTSLATEMGRLVSEGYVLTVLAPNDEAMAKLTTDQLSEPGAPEQIIYYHIIPEYQTEESMYNAVRRFGKIRYDTLRLPHKVAAQEADGSVKFGNGDGSAYLFDPDIYTDGRISVQGIDGVLFPREEEEEDNKAAARRRTTPLVKVAAKPRRGKLMQVACDMLGAFGSVC